MFRIQSNIYDGAFLRKLTARSFILDIRTGSKYPSDEQNKLFSFSIKATLKATTLGIRMCSAELLLWKNPKVRLVIPCFYVNETPPLTFSYGYSNWFWTSHFTKQLRTTDCKWFFKLQMVCSECEMIVVFLGLRKGSCRNIIEEILQLFWEQW